MRYLIHVGLHSARYYETREAEMIERIVESSPRFKERMAGGFYLLSTLTRVLGVGARDRLVGNGDGAAFDGVRGSFLTAV